MSLAGRTARALDEAGFASMLAGKRVTVVVPDPTRPLPLEPVLGPLLASLSASRVTVLVGLGLHRRLNPTERERYAALCRSTGAWLCEHHPDAVEELRVLDPDVGGLARPLPAVLNARVVEAEARVLVGIVEPHQYAGFSGGAKGVAIGAAGRATISGMHGLELLRRPHTRIGVIDGNPFQAALWRIVEGLGPTFALQVVPAPELEIVAGPLREAFDRAVEAAERRCFVDVPEPLPAVVTQVPDAKAKNFYQASRAVTYLAEVDAPAVSEGGVIIVEAACPEGLGQGAGEVAFGERLETPRSRLIAELAGEVEPMTEPSGGAQRAYVLARALGRFRVALVGAPKMPRLERLGVLQASSIDEVIDAFAMKWPPVRLTDVFRRVPRYRGAPWSAP